MAEERAARTEPELAATLAGLCQDTVAIGEQLRRIAHGISPPLLAERGLTEALAAQTAHGPIPSASRRPASGVRRPASGVGLGEPRIEIAVYLCCLELIQNPGRRPAQPQLVVVPAPDVVRAAARALDHRLVGLRAREGALERALDAEAVSVSSRPSRSDPAAPGCERSSARRVPEGAAAAARVGTLTAGRSRAGRCSTTLLAS